jgi:hypothetical protein
MNHEFQDPMDTGLLQLERELRSLTPASTPRHLEDGLAAAISDSQSEAAHPIDTTPRNQSAPGHFPWRRMAVPAAAAAAVVFAIPPASQPQPKPPANPPAPARSTTAATTAPAINWVPMPARREFRILNDQGFLILSEATPMLEYQIEQTEHREWRNPQDNSLIRMTIPSQQRVLLPAAYR